MSLSERLRAEIAFHEKMFFTAVAVVFALSGWITEKAATMNNTVIFSVLLAILFAIGFSTWNYRQINTLLKELENA